MEAPVEIRYAGVVVGRAQEMRSADGDPPSFFLVMREPMPVGSVLRLRAGGRETPARVVHTVESPDPAVCGMQVCLIGEGEEAATEWIPPPAAEKPRPAEAPAETAMPVIEVGPPVLEPVSVAKSPSQVAAEPQEALPVAPAEVAPVEVAPVEAAPVEVAPVEAAPVEAAPVEVVPVEAAPADATEAPRVSPAPPASQPTTEKPATQLSFSMETAIPAASSGEIAAIPEAVPAAVGSSMTGALENAAEGVTAAVEANGEQSAAAPDAGVAGEEQTTSEDLPPARPIAGPSGRRKTKRRR
jgi:hypothetical protein